MSSRIRGLPILVIVLFVFASSCGGDADEGAAATPGTSPTTAAPGSVDDTDDPPATTTSRPEESSGPQLACTDPVATEIGLGNPVTGEITGNSSEACYWVEVPDGLDSITIELSGVSANLAVNIGYGYVWNVQYPGSNRYWDVRPGDEPSASTTIESPTPGPYFLLVSPNRPNAASSFDLAVTAEPSTTTDPTGGPLAGIDQCESPASEIAAPVVFDDEVLLGGTQSSDNPRNYYCVMVPDGTDMLTVSLSTGGVLQLNVWHSAGFTSPSVERTFQGVLTLVVDSPTAGPNYIVVSSVSSGGGEAFTMDVSIS